MGVKCFFLEPTDRDKVWLRRYSRDFFPPPHTYHNAMTFLDVRPADREREGSNSVPHDDSRWPLKCEACPYVFTDRDHWQLFESRIYRRTDTGEETTLIGAWTRDARIALCPMIGRIAVGCDTARRPMSRSTNKAIRARRERVQFKLQSGTDSCGTGSWSREKERTRLDEKK